MAPVHDLVLVIPLHPLSKLLAIKDNAQNLEEQLCMGGRREVGIQYLSNLWPGAIWSKKGHFFWWECLDSFATGRLSPSYAYSLGARLLNGVNRGALFAPKEVVIKNTVSFS